MGEIRRHKNSKNWEIRWYRNGKRREESSHTTSYEKARDLLRDRENAVSKGVPVSAAGTKLTYDLAAQDLINDYEINDCDSLDTLKRRLRLHLTPWFTGFRMVEIEPPHIRAYRAARKKEGAAVSTINRELAALKRMFSLAMEDGRLHAMPYIPMLAENNARKGFLEPHQFEEIAAFLKPPVRAVARFGYLTGWRMVSEVLTLEWRHVDWAGRMVRLEPGESKTDDGRTFPFTLELESLLKAQLAEHERLKKAGKIVKRVFHRNGKPIKDIYDAWRSACVKAGYPGKLLHDMRRSAARNYERAGVGRSAAKAMIGHKTDSMYNRYSIPDSTLLREAAAKIDRAQLTTGGVTGGAALPEAQPDKQAAQNP